MSFSDFLCGKCLKTFLFYKEIRGAAAQIPKTRELKEHLLIYLNKIISKAAAQIPKTRELKGCNS